MSRFSPSCFLFFLGLLVSTCAAAQVDTPTSALQEDSASVSKSPVIDTVILEGNTLFSDEELAPIIVPYQGRALSANDIQALKNALTLQYISQGYLNSGVTIPQQDLSGGILRLQVIEGRLLSVNINGNNRLRNSYIQQRVEPGLNPKTDKADAPLLNVNELQQRLRLLEQDPLIERLNANLKPGIRPGEAELDLTVEEARAYYFKAMLDNHLSPNVGDLQGSLSAGHLNLLGFGDSLALSYRRAEGLESYGLEYSVPLGARGTSLTFSASDSDSEVVSEPFDPLNVTSESESYGLSLRYPVSRTLTTEFALGLGFEQRRNGSFLLGDAFAFFNSGPDGQSQVNVLSFSQDFVYRRTDQVWAVQSRFDFGLDVFDATTGDEPDGIFNTWLGQSQWLRQFVASSDSLWPSSQLLWRLLVRLTDDPMLSSEQFALGGSATVRGYRENQLTRDNGLATSLEWRVDVGHWLLPGVDSGADASRLQAVPFIDYGNGWNSGRDTPDRDELISVGLGLRWSVSRHWSAQLYWAEALNTVASDSEYSLQDDGVHFQLGFTL